MAAAASIWRSGQAGAVRRNTAGALTITEMPCGTIGWFDGQPAGFAPATAQVNAVLGGVMAGWGTMLFLLAGGPMRDGDGRIARAVLAGLVVWFVVDSTFSFVSGIPGNVVLNVGSLAALALPLALLCRPPAVPGSPGEAGSPP